MGNLLTILTVYFLGGKNSLFLASSYGFSVFCWGFISCLISLNIFFPEIITAEKKSDLRGIVSFSWPLIFVTIISTLIYWVDTLMIGMFRSPEEVGLFSAASRTSPLVVFFLVAIGNISAPFFSEYYYQNRFKDLEKFARNCANWTFFVSLPIAICFMIFSNEIMALFGSEFTQGSKALVYLAAGQVVNAATGLVGQVLIMSNQSRTLAIVSFLSAIINIVLNLIFIPRWGITGAAIASSITLALMNIILAFSVKRLLNISVYASNIPKILFIALLSFCVFVTIKELVGPYVAGFLFIIMYVYLIYRFVFGNEDKMFIKSLVFKPKYHKIV